MTEAEIKAVLVTLVNTTESRITLLGTNIESLGRALKMVEESSYPGADQIEKALTLFLSAQRRLLQDDTNIAQILRGDLAKMEGASAQEVAEINQQKAAIEATTRTKKSFHRFFGARRTRP